MSTDHCPLALYPPPSAQCGPRASCSARTLPLRGLRLESELTSATGDVLVALNGGTVNLLRPERYLGSRRPEGRSKRSRCRVGRLVVFVEIVQ